MVIILLGLFSLGLFFYYKPKLSFRKDHLLLALGFYFLHLVGLLNSQNLKPVFQDLEQKVSLLAFPMIWVISPRLTEVRFHWVLKTFVLVTLVTSLLTFRNGFSIAWKDELIYEQLLVHRPYLGMYCLVSVFFCLEIIQTHASTWWKAFSVASILILVGFLVVILAKMAVVCLFLVGILYFFFRLYIAHKTKTIWVLVGTLFFSLILSLFLIPEFRAVMIKLWSFETFRWEEYNQKLVNSLNIRFVLWSCTFALLAKDVTWLWGVGKGDAQPLLNNCYDATVGPSFFSENSLISHNQYLTSWLNLGLLGLVGLLVFLTLLLYTAIKRKQVTFFSFICILILLMVPESILEMQKGVVFFSFFYALFLFGKPAQTSELA